jgi:transcriptional regulator with XRE-family HTH domain
MCKKVKVKVKTNLRDIIEHNDYTIASFAKAIGVESKEVAHWATGTASPSEEKMKYISGWLCVPITAIWPSAKTKTDWNVVFSAITDRLSTINYHEQPALYTHLCNKRSIASVKLYAKARRAYIVMQDSRRKYYSTPLTPSDFAIITPMQHNVPPSYLKK